MSARVHGRAPEAEAIDTVLRLAVLLAAGAAPARAWGHLVDAGAATVRAAADAAASGGDVGRALAAAGGPWRDVAAVWSVAVATGAPLAETLRSSAVALRDAAEVAADVRVALAEPVATARLIGCLPLLGVPLGAVLGFDPVGVLVADPVGGLCLAGGLALMLASAVWTHRLAVRARPPARVPGLVAELWAVALSAGVSVQRARALIDEIVPHEPAVPARERPACDEVEATLALAVAAGVPAAELLRGDAWLARHRARADGRADAARLATRLLVPLGVCTLPAFLLLAVVPLLLGILRSGAVP